MFDDDEEEGELSGGQMSFGDHLEELRGRIFKAAIFTFLAFIVTFYFHEAVLRFVLHPYNEVTSVLHMDSRLKLKGPTAGFFAYMKVSLIVALMVAAPAWMFQFWQFIAAGLYKNERRSVYKFAPPMLILFAGGVTFGYQVLIPIGLRYLLNFSDSTVLQNWFMLGEYLTLFTTLTLVLGVTFQLPIVMALLAKLELVGVESLRAKRRFFVLGAFVFGAILTPPDVITQILMATPLVFLFEFGIFLAWLMEGEKRGKVDWPRWRKRAAWAALVIGIMSIFAGEFGSVYRERKVARMIRTTASDADENVPYMEMFQLCEFVGFKTEFAFRYQEGKKVEKWVVAGGDDARLVLVRYSADRLQKTSRSATASTFTLNASSQSIDVDLIESPPGNEFMVELIQALGDATEDDKIVVARILEALVQSDGPKEVSLPRESPSEDEIESVVDAWSEWWKTRGDTWVYRAGR